MNLKNKMQNIFLLQSTPPFKNCVFQIKKKLSRKTEDFFQEKFSFCKSCVFCYKSFLLELLLFHFLQGKGTLCLYWVYWNTSLWFFFLFYIWHIFPYCQHWNKHDKHSFPESSHAKVAWAMYLFCCLYYPVENRENLALSQVLKNKVKMKLSCH